LSGLGLKSEVGDFFSIFLVLILNLGGLPGVTTLSYFILISMAMFYFSYNLEYGGIHS